MQKEFWCWNFFGRLNGLLSHKGNYVAQEGDIYGYFIASLGERFPLIGIRDEVICPRCVEY